METYKLSVKCAFSCCWAHWVSINFNFQTEHIIAHQQWCLLLLNSPVVTISQRCQSGRYLAAWSNDSWDNGDGRANVPSNMIGQRVLVHHLHRRINKCLFPMPLYRFALLRPIYRSRIAWATAVIHCFHQATKYYSHWPLACIGFR